MVDPVESSNILVTYMSQIVIGLIGIFLGVLKILGSREKANHVDAILKERPVSHAELKDLELRLTKTVNEAIGSLRTIVREDVKALHSKVDNLKP